MLTKSKGSEGLADLWMRLTLESLELQEEIVSRRRKANLALVGFLTLHVILISLGLFLLLK